MKYRNLIAFCTVLSAITVWFGVFARQGSASPPVNAQPNDRWSKLDDVQKDSANKRPHDELEGFNIGIVRFDESVQGRKATPKIPKTWKLISVSNGESPNSNNLWFQDIEGHLYLLQGFTAHQKFTLVDRILRIEVAD